MLFAAIALACHAQTGYVQASCYPAITVADGHSSVTVTATANSATGSPVPDGTLVLFETDIGTFRQNTVTTRSGVAQAILVAGTIAGSATVKIKVLGLPIPPQETTVEFVANRSMLSTAREYIEIVSPTYLKYSPQDKVIVAEAANHGVSIRYREIEIHADIAQLSILPYELRAQRATVKIGRVTREYKELNLTLNTRKGHGVTSYTVQEPDGLKAVGDTFAFITHPVDLTGYVDVNGAAITRSETAYVPSLFTISNLDDSTQPALIAAKKVTVLPNREVQFQRAELYLGDSKVLKMQLFRAPLTGASPIFVDQIINVNDNQLNFSYPYYLNLKPGETSLLRFHIGDHTGQFGNANGPQVDYQLDWNHGDAMDGGFLLSGIGLRDWGVGLHQSYRFDDRSNMFFQVESPELRSVFGSANASRQFNGYSASLSANVTETLTGPHELDQNFAFDVDRDPQRIFKSPFRWTFGAQLSHQSTSLAVPIQTQDAHGVDLHLMMDPKRFSKSTVLTMSATASKLEGRNVNSGVALASQLALNHQISSHASVFVTYDFSTDTFTDSVLGSHRLTAQANYQQGGFGFNASASRSIGVDRLDYSAQMSYRLTKFWRLGYSYIYDRALGTSFLDYQAALYFRIGQREFGIVWSRSTNRFGIQVLGATFN
ncbi:MAG: Ig-like domain-containing protein [Fimbriimonadaceae bacterium]